MSLNDKMTGLANTVRNVSGVTSKLGVDDMKTVIGQLSSFMDYGDQGTNADCNNFNKVGTYLLHSNTVNAPTTEWGFLLVLSYSADNIEQIFTAASSYTMYFRLHIGDRAWSAWHKIGGIVKAVLSALHLERRCLA